MDGTVPKLNIKTTDMHHCGQPLRIIESGYPDIKGNTILDKLRYCKENLDHLRKLLILEPRGSKALVALLLIQPDIEIADLGLLLLDNEGYFTMCGDAVVAISRYAIDKGIILNPSSPETTVKIQLPCGLIESRIQYENGKTGKARFQTVPAFSFATGLDVAIEGYKDVKVDISYGGAFYIIVPAISFNLEACKENLAELIDIATKVKDAVKSKVQVYHPEISDMSFIYGVIMTDNTSQSTDGSTLFAKHVVINADKQVVISPCGSGTTARVAVEHAQGHISLGQQCVFESAISGGTFTGKVVKRTTCGEFDAVIAEVSGQVAHYTSNATFTLEDDDPLREGLQWQ